MEMKIGFLYIYNIILAILVIGVIFVIANFWLGTIEQYEELTSINKQGYFFSRLLIAGGVSVVATVVLYLLNYIYWRFFKVNLFKKRLYRIAGIELISFMLFSVLFILIGM